MLAELWFVVKWAVELVQHAEVELLEHPILLQHPEVELPEHPILLQHPEVELPEHPILLQQSFGALQRWVL